MSCLAEERFVEIQERGGLTATRPDERTHLEACDACRESWAMVAAAGDVLVAARPKGVFKGRLFPVLVAAAMLLTIVGVIVVRSLPAPVVKPQDPIVLFLEGKPEAREALLQQGRKALPALVAARPKFKAAGKLQALQDLMFEIKVAAVKQDPDGLAVYRKLDSLKIDLAFESSRLEDILGFVRDFSGLNIVLDPTIEGGVVDTFNVRDTSMRASLEILCAVKELDYDLRYGVLFVSAPLRLWSTDKGVGLPAANAWTTQVLAGPDAEIAAKLRAIRLTTDMQNAALRSVAEYFQEISGVRIEVAPLIAEAPISIRVADGTMGNVLAILTLPRGWEVRIQDGAVRIAADR
jgi:hypothetical protein